MSNALLNSILADNYLRGVLNKYAPLTRLLSPTLTVRNTLDPVIQRWAGNCLHSIQLSGSTSKGTAIRGQSDVDLFVSLHSFTEETLENIYKTLFNALNGASLHPKKRNVSIQCQVNGTPVDITPGRRHEDNSGYHGLWRNRVGSHCQTNIQEHIGLIQRSGCLDEIRLTKIWRNLNGLEFPSFYLELSVLRALSNNRTSSLSSNFVRVRQYLRDEVETALIIDPTRSTNIVSDDLTQAEKLTLAAAAERSLKKQTFQEVIW